MTTWNLLAVLEAAISKAEGVRGLARELDWHHPDLTGIRAGGRISLLLLTQN